MDRLMDRQIDGQRDGQIYGSIARQIIDRQLDNKQIARLQEKNYIESLKYIKKNYNQYFVLFSSVKCVGTG